MFQTFYESFWQHPLLLWAPSVLFLVFVRPGGTIVGRAAWLFAFLSIVDAFFTGPVIHFVGKSPGLSNVIMIFFVLLGDFRLFYFVERFSTLDAHSTVSARDAAVRAAGWALVVPVLQGILTRLFPHVFQNVRYTFLCYEILFLALAAFFLRKVIPRRALPADVRHWQAALFAFAMVYYACWALADIVILSGFDVGYLIRAVPNVLYYGLFVPFVFWRAPPRLKTPQAT